MKKLLIAIILLSMSMAATTDGVIKESLTKAITRSGYQFLNMEVRAQTQATANGSIIWYADNIAGYGSIDFYGMSASAGSAPTTISAQAIYPDGTAIGAAQIITSGTDLTDIRSPFYKFTLPVGTANRTVSFEFLIAD